LFLTYFIETINYLIQTYLKKVDKNNTGVDIFYTLFNFIKTAKHIQPSFYQSIMQNGT